MIIIRKAEINDLPSITEIYNDAIRNTTATFDTEDKTLEERVKWLRGHDDKYPVLVALSEDKVCGWASLSEWSDRLAYSGTVENSIYISSDKRGKGIGTKLLLDLLRKAKENGFHTVIARIADNNPPSIKLHITAGFVTIGVMKEVGKKFGRMIDVTMMQKIL